MVVKNPTVIDQIKSIAKGIGLEEEQASLLAKKCYDEVYWRPYGGATSFAEIDSLESAREYSYKIDTESYKLRSIVDNIISEEDSEVSQKVSAIQMAASEFGNRIDTIEIDNKSLWEKVKELFLGNKVIKKEGDEWVVYSKAGRKLGTHESRASAVRQLQAIEANKEVFEEEDLTKASFKIFKDKTTGEYRWLSFSSNAFEDREKELFSTQALEEAVVYAEKNDERGPLMVFHVPGTEIGTCDFQGIQGRFLIESGTFDDTPLGNKALEYFLTSNEDHQVSIGYKYLKDDEKDGTYDWLRFRERSVCPFGTAANPWTDFGIIGGNVMDEQKKATLVKIFGQELASSVMQKADEKTKELEEQNVRFKASSEEEQKAAETEAFLRQLAKNLGVEESKALEEAKKIANSYSKDDEEEEKKKKEEGKKDAEPVAILDNEKLGELVKLVSEMAEELDKLGNEIKILKEAEKTEEKEEATPRLNVSYFKASESDKNNIDNIKEILGSEQAGPVNPAAKYVEDILGMNGRVAVN